MTPPKRSEDESVSSEARELFAEFLLSSSGGSRGGSSGGIDSLCRRAPHCAEELRELHRRWEGRLGGSSEGGSPSKTSSSPGRVDVSSAMLRDLGRFGDLSKRFQVRDEVARGGMGRIFRVWDEKLRRMLAMKTLVLSDDGGTGAEELAEKYPRQFARFFEEAQITSQLDHPGIVPVQDMGIDENGQIFFTMKLVKGRDLKKILEFVHQEKEGWSQTRALGVILKVCEAMAFAHAKGVIHRDLKPSNIMVGRFGETYVMDWGLAKVVGGDDGTGGGSGVEEIEPLSLVLTGREGESSGSPNSTVDGDVVGTPSYMAPEQALGLQDEIGPRSDVYAVGSLLYDLLTCRAPYSPQSGKVSAGAVLRMLIDGPPTPILEIKRDVPPELVAICEKAMERESHARYVSMEAMGNDLRAYLENRVVGAYQTGAIAEFRKWVGRNRGVASGFGLALMLAILGLSGIAWVQAESRARLADAYDEVSDHRDRAIENEQLARGEKERADRNAREALRNSYVANLYAADASLRVHEIKLTRHRLESCDPALRGWEWDHLSIRTDSSLRVLTGHTRNVTAVEFSPDGRHLASGAIDGDIRIFEVDSGVSVFRIEGGLPEVTSVAYHPSGTQIAAGFSDGAVRVFHALSGEVAASLGWDGKRVTDVAFDPAGRLFAATSSGGSVRVFEVETWAALATHEGNEGISGDRVMQSAAFSPDGRTLAVVSRSRLHFWRTRDWKLLDSLSASIFPLEVVAYGPRGRRVATGDSDGSLRIFNGLTRKSLYLEKEHGAAVLGAAFSPDGRELATSSRDNTIRIWETHTAKTRATLHGHQAAVSDVDYSPDGMFLASASADTTIRIWTTAGDVASYVVNRPGDTGFAASCLEVAAGPRRMVLGGHSGALRIVDGDAGRAVESRFGHIGQVVAVASSPNGRYFASGARDGTVRLWDAEKEDPIASLSRLSSVPSSLRFSPDGARIMVGFSDGTVRAHRVPGGELLFEIEAHDGAVRGIAFSESPAWFVTGGPGAALRIWDGASGEAKGVLAPPHATGGVRALAVSRDGRLVAAGRLGFRMTQGMFLLPTAAALEIWERASGTLLHDLQEHAETVTGVAFSPDGDRVATSSMDGTVRVWDPMVGISLIALRDFEEDVVDLAFTDDGTRIVTCDADGEVRVLDSRRPLDQQNARMRAVGPEVVNMNGVRNVIAALDEIELRAQDPEAAAGSVRFFLGREKVPFFGRFVWSAVKFEGERDELYRTARTLAEVAGSLYEDVPMQAALGAAYFRCGDWRLAVDTLVDTDPERDGLGGLAFLSMAQHALGETTAARATRNRIASLGNTTGGIDAGLLREVDEFLSAD